MNKDNNKIIIGAIASILIFVINIFFIPSTEKLFHLDLSKKLFYVISLCFSAIIFFAIYQKDKKSVQNFTKYFFLTLFVFSASISLIPIKDYSHSFYILYEKLVVFQTFIIIPTSAIGFYLIYSHKKTIQLIVDKLFSARKPGRLQQKIFGKFLHYNESSETKTDDVVPQKNKQSLNILHYSLFAIIIIISVVTLFYRLDNFDLFSDEAQVTQGAAGYYHTGEYKLWDFTKEELTHKKYNRSRPHQFVVAQSYKIFGISTWSSRFPSALFGVILIIATFLIGKYFIKDKWAILLVIATLPFFVELLFLQRWTRMYAMLMPLFLFEFYFTVKFLTEKNSLKFIKIKENSFFGKYLNFNFIYLPLLLVFLVLNYEIHINTILLFPIFLFFTLIMPAISKNKKYFVIILIGITFLIISIFFPYKINYSKFGFFEINNFQYYFRAFLGYPFSANTNIIIVLISIFSLFIVKNKQFRKNYLVLLCSVFIGLFLFSFILKRYSNFKYMSFISPLSIILIIGSYFLFFKSVFPKVIIYFISLLLIGSVAVHFNSIYNNIYERNFASPAKPSIAYQTIVKNYKKDELIYRHWGPLLYFEGIDKTAKIKNLPLKSNFVQILDTIKNYKSGWFVWHTHNSNNINDTLREYAEIYFTKYNGNAIDETGVEIFHFTDSMLADIEHYKIDRLFPSANLNMANPYSLSFRLKLSEPTDEPLFLFLSNNKNVVNLNFSILADNKWHHVVWYQEGGNINDDFGLIVDGQANEKQQHNSKLLELVKFKINTNFKGEIDDIRIYDFVLDNEQVTEIIKNKDNKNSDKLYVNEIEFKTLFHWQKR